MSEIRKYVLRRLIYIAVCIITFFIATYIEPIFKLVAVITIMVGCFNIFLLLMSTNELLDSFFPIKKKEKTASTLDKFLNHFSTGILLLSSIVFIFEIDKIDNTIHEIPFFLKFGFIGLIAGFLLILFLRKLSSTIFDSSERRMNVIGCVLLGGFFLLPPIFSLVNRKYADTRIHCQEYELLGKGNSTRESEFYVQFDFGRGEERLIIKQSLWEKLEEGQLVEICTRQGYLGYDFVVEIKLMK